MPSSSPNCIERALRFIIDEKPMTILDLGVGFGKWGHLSREYLELIHGNVYRRIDWTRRIDGVEGFQPYIRTHQLAIYDNIYIKNLNEKDVLEWLSTTDYDLYLAMDILEHLDDWQNLIKTIPKRSAIIALTPNGYYAQGAVFDNELEIHKHAITAKDLSPFFDIIEEKDGKLLAYRIGKK